jgi:hypothetical protein
MGGMTIRFFNSSLPIRNGLKRVLNGIIPLPRFGISDFQNISQGAGEEQSMNRPWGLLVCQGLGAGFKPAPAFRMGYYYYSVIFLWT